MNLYKTGYTQADRVSTEILEQQLKYFEGMNLMCQAFDSTNVMVAVLNSRRQIVYANAAFIKAVEAASLVDIAGQRPGEVMHCKNAHKSSLGCGASEACRNCNVMNALLTTMDSGEEATNEAVVSRVADGYEESMNMQVHVVPYHSEEEDYYIVSLIDSTDTIKKRFMERVFFHDVINTAGAIKNYISLLKDELPERTRIEMEFLEEAFQDMLGEIQGQKQLLEAENGELAVNSSTISSDDLLHSVKKLYERNDCGKGKAILIDEESDILSFSSDYLLLRRVLCNMLKNALEESEKGDAVLMGCNKAWDREKLYIEFWVKNKKYMPVEIQNQVFNKTFTTKGAGRGLGTYSMKLLGERYLKGIVGFTSDRETGTNFYIRLPL